MGQVLLRGGPFDGRTMDWGGGSTIEKPVLGQNPLIVGTRPAASTPDDAMIAIYRQDFGNRQIFEYQGTEHAAGGGG